MLTYLAMSDISPCTPNSLANEYTEISEVSHADVTDNKLAHFLFNLYCEGNYNMWPSLKCGITIL